MARLAKELALPVEVVATTATHAAMLNDPAMVRLTFQPALLSDGKDFELALSEHARPTDLVIIVSARARSISHSTALEQLPRRLDRQFRSLSLVLVYPASNNVAEEILELT